jgi:hypothetical protein
MRTVRSALLFFFFMLQSFEVTRQGSSGIGYCCYRVQTVARQGPSGI